MVMSCPQTWCKTEQTIIFKGRNVSWNKSEGQNEILISGNAKSNVFSYILHNELKCNEDANWLSYWLIANI